MQNVKQQTERREPESGGPDDLGGASLSPAIRSVLIEESDPVIAALRRLNETSRQILFVVDGARLKASLSDGDIRRFLLAGGTLDEPLSAAAHREPRFLMSTERERARSLLTEWHVPAIPIVDESMRLVDIVFRYETVDLDAVDIRVLTGDDLPMVLEFFDQMAGDTRAMFNRGDINRIRAIDHLSRKGDDGQRHFAAVIRDGSGVEKMVGYVFLWDADRKIPWVGIAVREEWKGKRLGRRLMGYLDDWARPRGYGGLMLTSVPANIRAHSLYVRMGFEYLGVYSDGEFLFVKRYER